MSRPPGTDSKVPLCSEKNGVCDMKHSRVRHLRKFASVSGFITAVASATTGCGDYSDRVESTVAPAATTSTSNEASTTVASTAPATTTVATTTVAETSTSASGPSTPPEALCEAVVACGGDVVGAWAATSSCLTVDGNVDMSGFGLGCTESPTTGELEVSGKWTFTADGMVTDETVTTGTQTIGLLASCLTVSGTVTACDRVGSAMTTIGFASSVCTDDAATGGCLPGHRQSNGRGRVTRDAFDKGWYVHSCGERVEHQG